MFPHREKSLRELHDYTQEYVGNYVHVSSKTVGAWERGTRQPSIDALKRLSNLYDVSIDYLLGETNVKTKHTEEFEPQAAHKLEGLTEEENKQIDNFIKFINSQKDDSDEK